jgi:glutamine synthetase
VQIESRLMVDLAYSYVFPAAFRYQNILIDNIRGLKEAGLNASVYSQSVELLNRLSGHVNTASELVEKMVEARKKANTIKDTREMAIAYCTDVKEAYFDELRYHVDKLEQLIDDKEWYLPKYRELVFLR